MTSSSLGEVPLAGYNSYKWLSEHGPDDPAIIEATTTYGPDVYAVVTDIDTSSTPPQFVITPAGSKVASGLSHIDPEEPVVEKRVSTLGRRDSLVTRDALRTTVEDNGFAGILPFPGQVLLVVSPSEFQFGALKEDIQSFSSVLGTVEATSQLEITLKPHFTNGFPRDKSIGGSVNIPFFVPSYIVNLSNEETWTNKSVADRATELLVDIFKNLQGVATFTASGEVIPNAADTKWEVVRPAGEGATGMRVTSSGLSREVAFDLRQIEILDAVKDALQAPVLQGYVPEGQNEIRAAIGTITAQLASFNAMDTQPAVIRAREIIKEVNLKIVDSVPPVVVDTGGGGDTGDKGDDTGDTGGDDTDTGPDTSDSDKGRGGSTGGGGASTAEVEALKDRNAQLLAVIIQLEGDKNALKSLLVRIIGELDPIRTELEQAEANGTLKAEQEPYLKLFRDSEQLLKEIDARKPPPLPPRDVVVVTPPSPSPLPVVRVPPVSAKVRFHIQSMAAITDIAPPASGTEGVFFRAALYQFNQHTAPWQTFEITNLNMANDGYFFKVATHGVSPASYNADAILMKNTMGAYAPMPPFLKVSFAAGSDDGTDEAYAEIDRNATPLIGFGVWHLTVPCNNQSKNPGESLAQRGKFSRFGLIVKELEDGRLHVVRLTVEYSGAPFPTK